MTNFNELGLSNEILKAVEEMGFENATDIQAQAIPLILQGKDVLGRSNTGTGKTAAFGLPAIDMVDIDNRNPQILILSPTRELDIQIATELRKFSKYKEGVKIVPIYGGAPIDRQIQLIKRGCGIIVGTPGRVMDHLRRKTIRFSDIKMVILDEADEMLNMGFKEDIEEILKIMPKEQYQMTLFSATMPSSILSITKQFQQDPITVEIKSAQRTIDTVEQTYYECGRGKKTNALRILLNDIDPELTMIFCNTKKMVDELVDELNVFDMKAIGLHGDMKQMFRSRVMDQFRTGNYPILIATDVAARGIDVDNIDLVVNYDIPQDNEYYIHRVGRTGRAGKKGKAITLIAGKRQRQFIKDIMKYTKTAIAHRVLPSTEQMIEANKQNFINEVKLACSENISEESIEMANEILGEGIAIENVLSALISMLYKPEVIDAGEVEVEKTRVKKDRNFDMDSTTLHMNVGRMQGVAPNNIVCAIAEETGLSSNIIGKIDVKSKYTLVDIAKENVDKVLEHMALCTIKGYEVNTKIDMGVPKDKGYKVRERDGGDSRKRSSRSSEGRPTGKREGSSKPRADQSRSRPNGGERKFNNDKPKRRTRSDD